ncbi:MAG: thiamine phosphate synthase [Nitrospirae bacterium]|nr:thiamine phosphate synthase [Nitrospirota bacterium]
MLYGGICFITDSRFTQYAVEETVRMVLDAGIKWVQYREKYLTRKEIYYQAERLRRITEEYRAILIINDYADIALSVDADGVHLGQEDLPLYEGRKVMGPRIIGISTHNMDEAKRAEYGSADYIGYGPIYPTATKEDADIPKGTAGLQVITDNVNIPVVAIGGIKLESLEEIFKAGAAAVAVASAILRAEDPHNKAREFVKIIERLKNEKKV